MMPKEKFYTDNDIPVRFDVLVDGEPVRPTSVTVEAYAPGTKYLLQELIRPKSSEVFYKLPKKNVIETGQYVFVFKCRLLKYGLQSHVVRVDVGKLPGKKKNKGDL